MILKEMMKIKVNDADKGLIPSKRDEDAGYDLYECLDRIKEKYFLIL